ncbi:hypothetical protein CA51_47070 [Rosistilla oblonga]|uniref:MotA/TolQ/ExbB proton channel domain-containing protein n=1 Tax=Rosistilla oblonga TaxID=2527990 RepID=A0A518IVE2_9BACT|nr:MotA/TolQ/ExbB proton channel family protein [Rosistilla oblonga]QDV14797.1 hypothetical protein CA51_47070 [Rosistilla oblonga]QDV57052.1 hypothetical protein Mal33_30530 [Rosistilla oblonga]
MTSIENLLFDMAQLFWWPVLLLVLFTFAYALFKLGGFLIEAFLRLRLPQRHWVVPTNATGSLESMELLVLRELEGLRLCSRIAPMLGLVATMIPLGPALAAVSSGQSQITANSMGGAFAAVIIALVAASITFAIYTIRRRWLMQELTHWMESQTSEPEST